MRGSLAALLLALLIAAPLPAGEAAPGEVPPVQDLADVIAAPTEARIADLLIRLEAATGAEVAVLTLPDLGGLPAVDVAQQRFDAWKLGKREGRARDEGALILLAVADREVRIHTGYGLEEPLPDAWTGTTSRQAAREHFARGAYGEGLEWMAQAVAAAVAAHHGVQLAGVAAPARPAPGGGRIPPGLVLFALLMLFLVFRGGGRRRRRGWGSRGGWGGPVFMPLGGLGGWRGGGGGFGGGGGGFGGFGGGGRSGGGGGGASW